MGLAFVFARGLSGAYKQILVYVSVYQSIGAVLFCP